MFRQFISIIKSASINVQLSNKGKFINLKNQNPKNQDDYVILLHGIGRSCLQMRNLAKYLQKNGFCTINLSYPSTKYDLEKLAEIVHQKIMQKINSQIIFQKKQEANKTAIKEITIEKNITDRKIHFVGYSMGGLLLRVLLNKHQYNLGRVVQIGPPNQGSEVADFVQNWWLYKKLYGPSASQLITDQSNFKHIFGKVNYELGIIAGNGTIDPISSFLIIPGEDDGKVAVEKTKLEGMKEHIIIKVSHTFMPYNKKVRKQTLNFLKNSQFLKMKSTGIFRHC